jgi:hypothetical protein
MARHYGSFYDMTQLPAGKQPGPGDSAPYQDSHPIVSV